MPDTHPYEFKFLTQVHPGMFFLDHRLRPEVRAMFCAMSSRMPAGGIQARYGDIVDRTVCMVPFSDRAGEKAFIETLRK